MTIRCGINGFGRIGRAVLRLSLSRPDIEIVAINDLAPVDEMRHLLRYDSVHGRFPAEVEVSGDHWVVAGKKIRVSSVKDPREVRWADCGADIVIESTGAMTKREKAALHLEGGAKKVIVSAPSPDADLTVVMGINEKTYDPKTHHVISNASCTTNCLAPVVKVILDRFGLRRGLMTTIHSYTNDQNILDAPHSDLRRARAGALSQIPTTTGAAKAVGLVLPELKGKLDGFAMRVPTPNVSCIDLVCELEKEGVTREALNNAFREAAASTFKGILDYTDEPLVSVDFNGTKVSATVDGLSTFVIDGHLAKVIAWYDNETGFTSRMLDLVGFVSKTL